MSDGFGLVANIDAGGAEAGARRVVKAYADIVKAANAAAAAMNKQAGRALGEAAQAVEAAAQATQRATQTTTRNTAATRANNTALRERISLERQLQNAESRAEAVRIRINDHLGRNSTLLSQVDTSTQRYSQTLRTYGTRSVEAVRAQGMFTREMARTRAGLNAMEAAARQTLTPQQRMAEAFRRNAQAIAVLEGPLGGVAGRFNTLAAMIRVVNPLVIASVVGFAGLAYTLGQSIRVAEQFERSMFKTEAVLRATSVSSGLLGSEIRTMARDIGRNTLASTLEVEAAAQKLLTFRSVGRDSFQRVLELSQDLAEVGFGSINSAATQLGKALEDPINGLQSLTRVGVSFSVQQREQIRLLVEQGKLFEAQRIILDSVEQQVGGTGVAAAQGLAGAYDTLKQNVQEFLEAIGDTATLSIWESAIKGLANITAELARDYRSLIGIETDSEALARLTQQINRAREEMGRAPSGPFGIRESLQQSIDSAQQEIALILERQRFERELSRQAQERGKIAQENIARERQEAALLKEREAALKALTREMERQEDVLERTSGRAVEQATAPLQRRMRELTRAFMEVSRTGGASTKIITDYRRAINALEEAIVDLAAQTSRAARTEFNNLRDSTEAAMLSAQAAAETYTLVRYTLEDQARALTENIELTEALVRAESTAVALYGRGSLEADAYVASIRRMVEAKQAAQRESTRLSRELEGPLAKAFKEVFDSFDKGARDVFRDIFSGAMSSFSDFAEKLKNAFRSLLADLAYQAVARPIIIQVGMAAGGMLGLSPAASASVTGSNAPGLFDILGGARNIFSAGQLANNFAMSGVGSALGLSAGISAAPGAIAAGVLEGAGSGIFAASAAQGAVGAGGSVLTGAGSALVTAAPFLAAAAVVAVPLITSLMKKKPSDFTASFQGILGEDFLKTEDKANPETREARDNLQMAMESVMDGVRRGLGAKLPDLYLDVAIGSRDGLRAWLFGLTEGREVDRASKVWEAKFENADQLTAGVLQELLKQSEGLKENVRTAVEFMDFAEQGTERTLELLEFANNFDAAVRSLNNGFTSLADSIEGQVIQEVTALTDAVFDFKKNTKDAGLDIDTATAATKRYIEVILGIADSSERGFTETEAAFMRLGSLLENIQPLLDEVGIAFEDASAAIARSQERIRQDFIARVFTASSGGMGNVSGVLSGFRADRETAATLGVTNQVITQLRELRDAGLRDALQGMDGPSLRRVIQYYSTIEKSDPVVRLATEALEGLTGAAAYLTNQQIAQFNAQLRAIDAYLSELEATQRRWQQLADNLRDTRLGLLLDTGLTTLSPRNRLAEAERQFEDIATRALAGDEEAMAELNSVSRAYLEASRSYYASSEGYFDAFYRVQGVLSQAETHARSQLSYTVEEVALARSQLETLQRQLAGTDLIVNSLAQANTLLAEIASKIAEAQNAVGASTGITTPSSINYADTGYTRSPLDLIQGIPRHVRDSILLSLGQTEAGGGAVQARIATDPAFAAAFRNAIIAAGGLPDFNTGGSFTVGGAGGMDSNLVSFMATRGEHVNVSREDSIGSLAEHMEEIVEELQALRQLTAACTIEVRDAVVAGNQINRDIHKEERLMRAQNSR